MSQVFDLKLGFMCNNDCRHCVVASKRKSGMLPLEEVVRIIDQIPRFSHVQVTGGEPSIMPDLPEILKRCKQRDLFTDLQSNATGFSDYTFLKDCQEYIDHVHVAIHSVYPEIHDDIVRSQGMHEKTMNGFYNLRKFRHIELTTQTVISQYNIDSLYDTFKWIQEIHPGIRMSMTYPHLMGNAYTYRKDVAFRYSDKKEVIQKTLKDFGKFIFTESIPPCYLYPYFPQASLEWDLLRRTNNRTGIDFSDGMDTKDYNFLDVRDRRKAPRCKECVFNRQCVGVWKEYVELFKDKLDLFPVKEQCNECNV